MGLGLLHAVDAELLNLAQAADALAVSERTLRRYVRDGKIATLTHGGRLYVERSTITAYFERQRADGSADAAERQARHARELASRAVIIADQAKALAAMANRITDSTAATG